MASRVLALVTALILLTPLVIASRLTPDPRGLGTHEQLGGLTQCPFLVSTGHPCATCGMTTAFAHAAHGNLRASFLAQPFGLLLALACASGFWIALHVFVTGSRAQSVASPLTRPRVIWTLAGLMLLAWGYKVVSTPTPHEHDERTESWHP